MKNVSIVAVISILLNLLQGAFGIYQHLEKQRLEEQVVNLQTFTAAAAAREALFTFRRDEPRKYKSKLEDFREALLEQLRKNTLDEDVAYSLQREASHLEDERQRIIAQILAEEAAYRRTFGASLEDYKPSSQATLETLLGTEPVAEFVQNIKSHYQRLRREDRPNDVIRLTLFVRAFDRRAVTLQALSDANVRSGAGIEARPVTAVVGGTELLFLDAKPDGSWIFVEIPDGRRGWVYVRLVATPESPPGGVSIWI